MGRFLVERVYRVSIGMPLDELIDVYKFRTMSQATMGFWVRNCLVKCVLREISGLMSPA